MNIDRVYKRRFLIVILLLLALWGIEYVAVEREFVLVSENPRSCSADQHSQDVTQLMLAAEQGDPVWVKRVIKLGCDINARDEDGRTALHYAAKSGEPLGTVVRILLSAGAQLDARDKYGNTPLLASFDPHASLTDSFLLLRAGANPNAQDVTGASPLFRTVQDDNVFIAKLLLRRGADPNLRKKDGSTLLMEAARLGNLDMVELLLQSGANKSLADINGHKAADFAASPEPVFVTDRRSREKFQRIVKILSE